MSTVIIKDFKGWNLITEADNSSTGVYTGSRSESDDVYTGAEPVSTGSADSGSAVSGPADSGSDYSGSADSGSDYSGSADADVSDSSDILDKESILSGAADGQLTVDDIKKIQAVVFSVQLNDTETCDGKVGQTTIDKIKEFRTTHEIQEQPNIEPKQTTIGPLTLAKISEILVNG